MKNSSVFRAMDDLLPLPCVVPRARREDVVDIDGLIVGGWQLTGFAFNAEGITTNDGTLDIKGEGGGDIGDLLIAFHADGTTSYSGVGFTLAYTVLKDDYPIAGQKMRMQSLVMRGAWKREGDKLIVDCPGYGGDPLKIDIVSLTESELHLAATVAPVMPLPKKGYTSVTAAVDAHFVRTTLPVRQREIEEVFSDPIIGTWRLFDFSWITTIYPVDPEHPTIDITFKSAEDTEARNVEVTFHPDGTTSFNGNTFTGVMTTWADGIFAGEQAYHTQPGVENGATWKRITGVGWRDKLALNHPNYLFGSREMDVIYVWHEVPGDNTEKAPLILFANMPPPVPVPGVRDIDVTLRFYRVYEPNIRQIIRKS